MGKKYLFIFKVRTWGGSCGGIEILEDDLGCALEELRRVLGSDDKSAFDLRTLHLERFLPNPNVFNRIERRIEGIENV